jgi:hypothetical protein
MKRLAQSEIEEKRRKKIMTKMLKAKCHHQRKALAQKLSA